MTKFNPDNKPTSKLTFGDILHPAMAITDQADADQYLAAYIQNIREDRKDLPEGSTEPEKVAKGNLGYFAGYYDSETRQRVERLFKCAHPVFGSIADNGVPTAEEALEAGRRLGAEHAKKNKKKRKVH